MKSEFEPVVERRIHQFINYAEGAWHTGQRNLIWALLSKNSVANGLRLKHFGDILYHKMKEELGGIISRIQVTIMTDEKEVEKHLPEAMEAYAERDRRIAGLTDESVYAFYSCTLCQLRPEPRLHDLPGTSWAVWRTELARCGCGVQLDQTGQTSRLRRVPRLMSRKASG